MQSLLKIAFRNIILHWRQSSVATISLATGLISLVMFQGYMKDVENMYKETFRSRMMYGDVIIEHQNFANPEGRAEPWLYGITPEQQIHIKNYLEKINNIDSTTRFLQIAGVVTNGKASSIFMGYGYDIAAGEITRGPQWHWNALYGSPLAEDEKQSVLLGQSLGSILGCHADKKEKIMDAVAGYKPEIRPFHCDRKDIQLITTTASGQQNALDLEVTGMVDALYKDVDDKYVVTKLSLAQTLMNTQALSYITVKFKNSESRIDSLIENFNHFAETSKIPERMIRWENHLVGDMYMRTMSLLSIFRNFVVSIIIAIAGLSIFNTMMKLVKERTREIGTLRSLGFLPVQVLFIFTFEALILSILGGSIGSIVAWVCTQLMNALGITYKAGVLVEPVPMRIMVSPSLYIYSFIFLSILATITTWIVCRSALRDSAADNLTHV